jgi:hypothetical protein
MSYSFVRFKEFLKKSPAPRPPPLTSLSRHPQHAPHPPLLPDDPEYYNDLPGKAPPPSSLLLPSSNLIDLSTELPYRTEYINSDVQVKIIQRYIPTAPFSLVLRKEYCDCPQRDSHAVHYT